MFGYPKSCRLAALASLLVLPLITSEARAVTYTNVPTTTDTVANVYGIDDSLNVAGDLTTPFANVFFQANAGSYTHYPFTVPGGGSPLVFGLANNGTMWGYYRVGGVTLFHGFKFAKSTGTWTKLDLPGFTPTASQDGTRINGVSPNGQYATGYYFSASSGIVSFIYTVATNTWTTITSPSWPNFMAFTIDDNGTVLGQDNSSGTTNLTYAGGVFTPITIASLTWAPGQTPTSMFFFASNAAAQFIGLVSDGTTTCNFLYNMTDNTYLYFTSAFSGVRLNNNGNVIGRYIGAPKGKAYTSAIPSSGLPTPSGFCVP
jgi:hypothetical protein